MLSAETAARPGTLQVLFCVTKPHIGLGLQPKMYHCRPCLPKPQQHAIAGVSKGTRAPLQFHMCCPRCQRVLVGSFVYWGWTGFPYTSDPKPNHRPQQYLQAPPSVWTPPDTPPSHASQQHTVVLVNRMHSPHYCWRNHSCCKMLNP